MNKFPTPIEDTVLSIIFESMNESRVNRSAADYLDIAQRLPPLKKLHQIVNERLRQIARSGKPPYEICRFQAGDKVIQYEPFPTAVSVQDCEQRPQGCALMDVRQHNVRPVLANLRQASVAPAFTLGQ